MVEKKPEPKEEKKAEPKAEKKPEPAFLSKPRGWFTEGRGPPGGWPPTDQKEWPLQTQAGRGAGPGATRLETAPRPPPPRGPEEG